MAGGQVGEEVLSQRWHFYSKHRCIRPNLKGVWLERPILTQGMAGGQKPNIRGLSTAEFHLQTVFYLVQGVLVGQRSHIPCKLFEMLPNYTKSETIYLLGL